MALDLIRRVISRWKLAELPVGRSFMNGPIKVERWRDHLRITDLTNAGKRGKTVLQLLVEVKSYDSKVIDRELDRVVDDVSRMDSYGEIKQYLEGVSADAGQEQSLLKVSEEKIRSIEVEPAGTNIRLKTKTGLFIEASPDSFHVVHKWYFGPEKQLSQDTGYWPDKKKDARIFYAWLKENMSKVDNMDIRDLTALWKSLGVRYDSH